MVRFGIRHETVTIDQELYKLYPLKGKFFANFMELMSKADNLTREAKKENPDLKEEDLQVRFTSADYETLCMLATESLIAAYPDANRQEVESFAAQNLMVLLQPMIKVNTPRQ